MAGLLVLVPAASQPRMRAATDPAAAPRRGGARLLEAAASLSASGGRHRSTCQHSKEGPHASTALCRSQRRSASAGAAA
eukprot:COSAG01_NODE_1503_length_10093_cov_8.276010_11_plen_79_part_00